MNRFSVIVMIFSLVYLFHSTSMNGQGLFSSSEIKNTNMEIHAIILPDGKSIHISWEPGEEVEEIIVARSNSIIDTPEKLYVADSLGRFSNKLKSGNFNHYDYNLKPGSYFYAIASVSDVRQRKVRLVAEKNYTTDPLIIEKHSSVTENKKLFPDSNLNKNKTVGAILVKAEGNNIRVNWVPSWNAVPGKTIYTVYRSSNPLSTIEEIKLADKLVEIPHPATTYLDQNLDNSQTLFYGVSVKEENSEEDLPLEKGKSFVRIFFIKNKEGKSEAVRDSEPTEITDKDLKQGDVITNFQVRGFGYTREGKGAILKWNHPPNADETTLYTIYASTDPFMKGVNSFVGGSVLKIGTLNYPKSSLVIREIKRVDSLYFAITAKNSDFPENYEMEEGDTTFKYEFDKDIDPNEPSQVPRETNWNLSSSEDSIQNQTKKYDPSYTGALGNKNPDSIKSEIYEKASNENNIPSTIKYSQISNEPGEISDIIEVANESKLITILKSTYARKDYHKAIVYLKAYINKESDAHLIGKSKFYLGISYYRVGQYRNAMNEFLSEETMDFNKYRTEFWKNQTLTKLGRGSI